MLNVESSKTRSEDNKIDEFTLIIEKRMILVFMPINHIGMKKAHVW